MQCLHVEIIKSHFISIHSVYIVLFMPKLYLEKYIFLNNIKTEQ